MLSFSLRLSLFTNSQGVLISLIGTRSEGGRFHSWRIYVHIFVFYIVPTCPLYWGSVASHTPSASGFSSHSHGVLHFFTLVRVYVGASRIQCLILSRSRGR